VRPTLLSDNALREESKDMIDYREQKRNDFVEEMLCAVLGTFPLLVALMVALAFLSAP